MSNVTIPWHAVGTMLDVPCTSEEAIKLAGLDWEVEAVPIVTADALRTDVQDFKVTRRKTDNLILGVVNKRFVPIQNRDAFKMFDAIAEKGEQMTFHQAGSLRNGARVFMTAKLPGVIEVGKGVGAIDEVERYLLLSNSHAGSRPLQMVFTPVRVVCENTLELALHTKKSADKVTKLAPRVSIRHNLSSVKKMEESARVMQAALRYYKRFGDFANFLYEKQLDSVMVRHIVNTIFPANPEGDVSKSMAKRRADVTNLFTSGKGHDRIAGSAWALLNAFGEYADHTLAYRDAATQAERAQSILFGGAKGLKQRAERVIIEAVS